MAERIVEANYPGFCSACRTKYPAGTQVKKGPSGKWDHAECPAPASSAQDSTARAARHDALYNEGHAGGGYNPHQRADNEVRADELERDGRVVAAGGGHRVTVLGLRADCLTGSAAQVQWGREVRANEVRGVLNSLAERARGRALPEADVLGLAGALQAVLALPETQAAQWWIDRRPQRGDALGAALRDQVRQVFNPAAAPPEHLRCTIEPLGL
ncbi:hypothetical protein [Myxococcus virescens]|uniref:Uncharacterized protein n=1 Tax=Myxococcus virescens TaxID=83456 RepID=A0A511HPD4_9BACT|nr:hypothetical protein [Myxococcus virescens]GEL75448.1 hypothetical protein MVI01_72320 [Myxococcus virescens]SDE53936.1 hypothetical protein SAMN04488504_108118 [Myxococcus virescens]